MADRHPAGPCTEPAEPMLREAALQVLRGWQAAEERAAAAEQRLAELLANLTAHPDHEETTA